MSLQHKDNLAIDPEVAERLGRTRYGLIKLWVHDVNGRLEQVLRPFVTSDMALLDAGSSRGDPDIPSLQRAGRVISCDVDITGLRSNQLAQHCVQAGLEALPFRDNSFDMVLCKFVIEHLAAPLHVFREFWRVLRPGGVVAVLTPNRLSPMALVSGAIPHRIKAAFKEYLFGGHSEDTFPTRYQANTPWRLRDLMSEAGFAAEHIEMLAGMWAFFIFSKPIALAVRALERFQMRVPGLRAGCTHMLGIWRKPLRAETV